MGKSYKREIKQKEDAKHYFNVLVRVHGKNPHTETYSMKKSHVGYAKQLGHLSENSQYLDWKPLGGKFFEGGIFEVSRFTNDNKYVYAYIGNSENPSFSLPKYLFKGSHDNKILVGYRER